MEKEGSTKLTSETFVANISASCAKVMGKDMKVKLQTTNAQELYNHFQVFKSQILIMDFRPKEQFEQSHLVGSINIPSDKVKEADFTNFDEDSFLEKFCTSETEKERIRRRKRLLVVLIAFDRNCDQLLSLNSSVFTSKFKRRLSSDSSEGLQPLKNAIMMQSVLVKERHRDCYLCKSGMNVFQDKYPFLCNTDETQTKTIADCGRYPSEIFEAFLYLSNCLVAKDADLLKTLGITHILNVTDNVPNYFEESNPDLEYFNIDINDVEEAPIEEFFEFAYNIINQVLLTNNEKIEEIDEFPDISDHYSDEFDTHTLRLDTSSKMIDLWENSPLKSTISSVDLSIETARQQNSGSKILVHCAMGKSRSATIVIMYIMKKFKLPFKTAFKLVSLRREKIDINPGFIEKLKEFENNDFKFATESSDQSNASTEAGDAL
ncbi:unnamed protein product [Moneuplotes crassus]|uniref:protein-tyrosine-phosphatase n=3 Tax=Euplotes crassus TaxID=5936 RepID=A0AAD1ULX8_EUPCR|nr:unnamed protein product [Moneuplotes crassus]